jgi:4-hydroxybenzoate polyprenyltransferase
LFNLKNLFYLLKVRHWIKNLSIFLPIFAAQSLDKGAIDIYLIHFLIFSLASSVVYLINNIIDYEKDLVNKTLKYHIDIRSKKLLYSFGSLVTLSLLFFISNYQKDVLILISIYLILSITYNLLLKKIKYLDIFTLALFHLLRIYYGSMAFNVELTIYFVTFCLSVFLMIGSNKRLYEIKNKFTNRPYEIRDKNKIKYLQLIFGGFSIISFLLYILASENAQSFHNQYLLLLNFLLLILIILNFLYFQSKKEQDVVEFIYKNKINFVLVVSFLVLFNFNSNFL